MISHVVQWEVEGTTWGIPQAGGPGIYDLATMWKQFYEILQGIDPVLGVGATIVAVGKVIKDKWKKRNNPPKQLRDVSPGSVFSFILRRQQWNASELASFLQISDEDAKNLLRLCRYKWDRRKLMYVQTSETSVIISKLNEAKWYD